MATVRLCDVKTCRQELKEKGHYGVTLFDRKHDLCAECFDVFFGFLKKNLTEGTPIVDIKTPGFGQQLYGDGQWWVPDQKSYPSGILISPNDQVPITQTSGQIKFTTSDKTIPYDSTYQFSDYIKNSLPKFSGFISTMKKYSNLSQVGKEETKHNWLAMNISNDGTLEIK